MDLRRVEPPLLHAAHLRPGRALRQEVAAAQAEALAFVAPFVEEAVGGPPTRALRDGRAVGGIGRGHFEVAHAAAAEALLEHAAERGGEDVHFDERVAKVGHAHGTPERLGAAECPVEGGHALPSGARIVFDADHALGAAVAAGGGVRVAGPGRGHGGAARVGGQCGQRGEFSLRRRVGQHIAEERHALHLVRTHGEVRQPLERQQEEHHEEHEEEYFERGIFHFASACASRQALI